MTGPLLVAGPRGRSLRGWLLAGGIVALAAVGLRATLFRPRPVDVRVVRVDRGLVEETVTSTKAGSLRSRRRAHVSVDAAGAIVEIHARQGARVKEGDPLISIDARDARAQQAIARRELAVSEALIAEAAARRDDAVRERERFRELRRTESASQSQLDQAETQVSVAVEAHRAAEARLEAQKAVVARAEVALDKCTLRAPFGGVVAELNVEVGEWAVPGSVALMLLDPDRLYVRAELDEVDLAGVRVGLAARLTFDPYKGRTFSGTVSRVAPYVSELQEQNRTVEIEVEVAGPLDLPHGTSADVEVILRRVPDVLRIPSRTLLEGNRVFVVREGTARSVPLRLGLRNWEYAEVREGLAAGEPVIASLESEEVKDGARLRVTGEDQGPP